MIHNGKVFKIEGNRAVVHYKNTSNCGGWAILSVAQGEHTQSITADNNIGAREGDTVSFNLPTSVEMLITLKYKFLPLFVAFGSTVAMNRRFPTTSGLVSIIVMFTLYIGITRLLYRKDVTEINTGNHNIELNELIMRDNSQITPLQN